MDIPTMQCSDVAKEKCWDEPREVCSDVPKEKCWDEPREVCKDVPREKCWDEPRQVCNDVPRQFLDFEFQEQCEQFTVPICTQVPRYKSPTVTSKGGGVGFFSEAFTCFSTVVFCKLETCVRQWLQPY